MSTIRVSNLQDTSGGNSSTPAAIANGIAKAWVNFNGTGVVAIRASYNVSSITDNGQGLYTVNFTNAFADANYSCVAISDTGQTSAGSFTTTTAAVSTRGTGGSSLEPALSPYAPATTSAASPTTAPVRTR